MNIVVIGSCTDSSNLAKELNKRLHNSIVARVDILKNIKQLLLQGMNVNTTKNLGTYIGDVESYDVSKLTVEQKKQISAALEVINSNVKKSKSENYYTVNTFDALTNGFPTGTYSFIKVYSGAIDEGCVSEMIYNNAFLTNSIFVVIKEPKDPLLPITVSKDTLGKIKKSAFAFIECEKANDIFKSEVFQLLFELNDEKEQKEEPKPMPIPEPILEPPMLAHIDFIDAGAVQVQADGNILQLGELMVAEAA